MALRYARRSKYNAKPAICDGIRFDSLAEARRYTELKLLEKSGHIRDLKVHPAFPIEVNGERICVYESDFQYLDVPRGTVVVEDCKGVRTALYILKKKLMRACHGIDICEVKA